MSRRCDFYPFSGLGNDVRPLTPVTGALRQGAKSVDFPKAGAFKQTPGKSHSNAGKSKAEKRLCEFGLPKKPSRKSYRKGEVGIRASARIL
jgi:hypothetical protein